MPCNTGQYSDPGASACSLCPPGKYSQLQGQNECTLCDEGKYSAFFGMMEVARCNRCAEGKHSGAGSSACVASQSVTIDGREYKTLQGLAMQPFPMTYPPRHYN
jgi:hypothetical protein